MTTAAGWASSHLVHVPMLALPALAAAVALLQERRRQRAQSPAGVPTADRRCGVVPARPAARPGWLPVLVSASLAAAVVHARVCPEHFAESALYGAFFLVAASAQIGYAVWVFLRPHRWLIVAGGVGNAAVIVLWLATRLVAIPLGPDAGEVEGFGALDVVASVVEAVAVLAAWLAVRPSTRRLGRPGWARGAQLAAAPAVLFAALAVSVLSTPS